MIVLYLVLYVLAAVSFFLFTLGVDAPRLRLLGLGVFFWSLVPLIQTMLKL